MPAHGTSTSSSMTSRSGSLRLPRPPPLAALGRCRRPGLVPTVAAATTAVATAAAAVVVGCGCRRSWLLLVLVAVRPGLAVALPVVLPVVAAGRPAGCPLRCPGCRPGSGPGSAGALALAASLARRPGSVAVLVVVRGPGRRGPAAVPSSRLVLTVAGVALLADCSSLALLARPPGVLGRCARRPAAPLAGLAGLAAGLARRPGRTCALPPLWPPLWAALMASIELALGMPVALMPSPPAICLSSGSSLAFRPPLRPPSAVAAGRSRWFRSCEVLPPVRLVRRCRQLHVDAVQPTPAGASGHARVGSVPVGGDRLWRRCRRHRRSAPPRGRA